MSFNNLLHLLEDVATKPQSGDIICYDVGASTEYRSWSYRQLLVEAQHASCALQSNHGNEHAIGPTVLLHFTSHWDNIVWFWGVMLAGRIPVMSTALPNSELLRNAHLEHLARTLIDPLCLTRATLVPEFAGQDAIKPLAVESLDLTKPISPTSEALSDKLCLNDTAAILLTSGSTGRCKAVCLSHGQILAAIRGKLSALPLVSESFLNWISLNHVAALVEVHMQAILARKTQIHVPAVNLMSEPIKFLDLIDTHRVSRTFAPNFFLAKLRDAIRKNTTSRINGKLHGKTANGIREPGGWDLSCLGCINSGGEANITRTCEELSDQLAQYGAPKNIIFPGFGMTETCAGAIFNPDCPQYDRDHQLEFASVGLCMPGIEMRITDGLDSNSTERVPTGQIGFLQVTGAVVFKEYFNNRYATAESFTSDGWFKTGDLAFIDQNGYLNLAGRSKETMIVNGVNYDPKSVENAVEEADIPGLVPSFSCCFSCRSPGHETEDICLVYLPAYPNDDLKARVETTNAISKVVMMATGVRPLVIPVDRAQLQKSSLGKLSRAGIKASYSRGEYKAHQDFNNELIRTFRKATYTPPKDEFEKDLLAVVTASLGPFDEDVFGVQTPILDLGITSVELIKLKKDLETNQGLWQEIPIVTLLTHHTVRDLGTALRKLHGSHVYNPVVKLQTEGTKTPLWLIHPGVGEVLVFLNLAKFVKDRPVYALRARGLNGNEGPFTNISEVVKTYHAAIKKEQPEGPYAIAGYSYGSMLAFEISKLLEANNDFVAFTGSFNLPPHIKTRMRQLDFKQCLLHLSYFLGLMTEEYARDLASELGDCSQEVAVDVVMQNASQARLVELALSRSGLHRWTNVAFALQSMAVDYEPTGSVPGLDCFYCIPLAVVATSKQQWLEDHLTKWNDFSRSQVRFHSVGGAHYTMLSPEHVLDFQKTLRRALEDRGI
ncbi:acetyl-CoA synthetase-like protein [Aspergillus granulosus]|uniref:Acetyl-CoA synthetase-like protein n=1 Tax=Aspergillus granulosus TaxID=176169 RepID=A0ABR4HMG7_9EURO